MMNIKRILTWAGLTAGTALALFASPAGAVSLTPFSFSTSWTGTAPKGDIWLNSVTIPGATYTSFNLVSGAEIRDNDLWTGGDTGAASSDRGDNAIGVVLEAATNASIADSLGNLNLNNIIDTEDRGSFIIDLFFSQATDRFFFWERGMNSKLLVQALNGEGSVLAEYELDSSTSDYAGFDIDTVEIGDAQRVGAKGLQLEGAFTSRLRVIANGAEFNGPDFKVVASVPEPATIAGTVLAAGAAIAARRKRKAQAEA